MTSGGRDALLLRGTARRLGLQAGLLVAAAVIVLTAVATLVVLREQDGAADRLLRMAVAQADDVSDPPAGMWLTLARGDRVTTSLGAPPGVPDTAALRATALSGSSSERDVGVDDRQLRVLTVRRDGAVVQAALDLAGAHAERQRLVRALLVVGGLGLLLAVGCGHALGRRAVRPLGAALALQRRFVADASHELRTPLTLLSTRAQLVHREIAGGGSGPGVEQDAAGVVADTKRMAELVEDVLVAADPRAPLSPVVVGELLEEVVLSSRAYAAERSVCLEHERGDLGREVVVPGQPAGLRRALLALADNAIEHTPAGGSVRLGGWRGERGTVRLRVTDTGSGVDPARRPELLARFHSGGGTSGRRHYGLGLALADEVAERHHGRLDIAAGDDGRGSTFTLVLPRVRAGRRRAWRWPWGRAAGG